MADTVRLQVEISAAQLAELENLRKLGGLKTKRELWDTAFTLLKWAVRKKQAELSIGSLNETDGGFMELEMPFLEHCASRTPSNQKPAASPGNSRQDRVGTVVTSLSAARNRGSKRKIAGGGK